MCTYSYRDERTTDNNKKMVWIAAMTSRDRSILGRNCFFGDAAEASAASNTDAYTLWSATAIQRTVLHEISPTFVPLPFLFPSLSLSLFTFLRAYVQFRVKTVPTINRTPISRPPEGESRVTSSRRKKKKKKKKRGKSPRNR